MRTRPCQDWFPHEPLWVVTHTTPPSNTGMLFFSDNMSGRIIFLVKSRVCEFLSHFSCSLPEGHFLLKLLQSTIKDWTKMNEINLLEAFLSYEEFGKKVKNLMKSTADPETKLLALEGLNRIESDVQRKQDGDYEMLQQVRSFLREWRCESPLKGAYSKFYWVPRFLRSLTIFKSYHVPLFIDNYGEK